MRRLFFELCFCSVIACTIWLSLSYALGSKPLLMLLSLYAFTWVLFVYENALPIYFGDVETREFNKN